MKAFVTGGTGFLGRHLINELLAHGCQVAALVRTYDRARTLPAQVQTLAGDVTRLGPLRAALRGVDVVFHTAAAHPISRRARELQLIERVNVNATRELLALAGDLGVPRIVYTSTAAVFESAGGAPVDETSPARRGPFESEYARSKHQAHFEVVRPLQAQGLPVILVCPGALFGPGDYAPLCGLLRQYARRRLPVMLGPETAQPWTYVRDAAAGLRQAAEQGRPGETYLLGGPALSLRRLFAAAERATGLPGPRLWLPAELARALAGALQGVKPRLAASLRFLAEAAPGIEAGKARRELGWGPRPLESGLAETVDWLKRAG